MAGSIFCFGRSRYLLIYRSCLPSLFSICFRDLNKSGWITKINHVKTSSSVIISDGNQLQEYHGGVRIIRCSKCKTV